MRIALTEQLRSCDIRPQPYALLDFPNHPNVGDSAIWLAELSYLKDVLGAAPAFVCERTHFDADSLRKALPHGPIFLHGGGNFGDVWPQHQRFREFVLQKFPGRLIVQFPQTIHFTDQTRLERTAEVIKRHSNFVLFVRDERSLEKARSVFDCPVRLAPDMVFYLRIARRARATCKLSLLMRCDKESTLKQAPERADVPEGAVIGGWREEDPDLLDKVKRWTRLLSPFKLGFNVLFELRRRELLFRNLARSRVRRGIDLLSSTQFVITDHLHCHILCVLLGIPHIVLDNSYGKLTNFIESWTKDCGLVLAASSLDEAIDLWARSFASHAGDMRAAQQR